MVSARNALHETLSLARSLASHPEMVDAISVAVAYYQRLGQNEQAAVWAGVVQEDPESDPHLFAPVCTQLEHALGSKEYRRILDDVVVEIISVLA